jgi:hypothetical protein
MKRAMPLFQPITIHLRTNPLRHHAAWYRWEFLRRNPNYHQDYDNFMLRFSAFFQKKGLWKGNARTFRWTQKDEDYFYSKIKPVLDRMCKKWQVVDLDPPKWQFRRSDGKRKFEGDSLYLPTLKSDFSLERMRELFSWGFTGQGGLARRLGKSLVVELDLTWPMKDMVDYAKRAISFAQRMYVEELEELGIPRTKSRRRFTDYDTHIQVWDLKQQGKSVADIAEIVFPTEVHARGESAVLQKVRDHLAAAKKLIDGQYKEIN